MNFIDWIWDWIFPDNRSEYEIEKEREFIRAVNQLKTLAVHPGGRISIDPNEIRDQVLKSREEYRKFISPLYRKC